MDWRPIPHLGVPLVTAERGVLALDASERCVRRLVGDTWEVDVALPRGDDDDDDDDDDTNPWTRLAAGGDRIVALREDALVADVDGAAPPRAFDGRRSAEDSDLFALDAGVSPPRPTLVVTEYDRSTWVLEGTRWRRAKSRVPEGPLLACPTPAGLFVLGARTLWRVTDGGWVPAAVVGARDEDDDEDDGAARPTFPTALACDPARRVVLAAGDGALLALEREGWVRIGGAPGDVVHLAVDRPSDRLVAATETGTFTLALASFTLREFLPGVTRDDAPPVHGPARIVPTVEVFDVEARRSSLGAKRGDELLACLPPDLVVFLPKSGRLRVERVGPGVLPGAPVLFDSARRRHVVGRLVAEAEGSDHLDPSGDTRTGGRPDWIQRDLRPACKTCKEPLRFRAQLCEDHFDRAFQGRVYVFDCPAGCGGVAFGQV